MKGTGREGVPIVLAASQSESCERGHSQWLQMLYATVPTKYARHISGFDFGTETWPDGQAKFVPNGLRVIEALLVERFGQEAVRVCYPEQLDHFVGPDTKVVGVHAHNPMGLAYASRVYSHLWGRELEPVNATMWRRLIESPVLERHRPRLIVGGPGAWQLEETDHRDVWGIDTIVKGECEETIVDLFEKALDDEELPRTFTGASPELESIPVARHRSTFGVAEITGGSGRGCDFCSPALKRGQRLPISHVVESARRNVAEGAAEICAVSEDIFLYEADARFQVNAEALVDLFRGITSVDGVESLMLSHATVAPVVLDPGAVEKVASVVNDYAYKRHPASTHPENRYHMPIIGMETASSRLMKAHMKGKCYPFSPEEWPRVVEEGVRILNRFNWFPFLTWIIGLPGETDEDVEETLELVYRLRDTKAMFVPTLFVPLENTRLGEQQGARLPRLTRRQWELFFTCWRYNLDMYHGADSTRWALKLGIPAWFLLKGIRITGRQALQPVARLAGWPEWLLRGLHLDFDGYERSTRWETPKPRKYAA